LPSCGSLFLGKKLQLAVAAGPAILTV